MTVTSDPRAGDLHSARSSSSPLNNLPKASWWKLFVDRPYHKETSPHLHFDRDKSKGFHAAMMGTFRQHLGDPVRLRQRLTFDYYNQLHEKVSTGVTGILNQGRSGTDSPKGLTTFPTETTPGKRAKEELLAEGVSINDFKAKEFREPNGEPVVHYINANLGPVISVGYEQSDVPKLAERLFVRYREERDNAVDPLQKLRSIVRLVRGLHVYHLFLDANGRLNTMVVLNKLLMQNGFRPTIVSRPGIFGGGVAEDDLMAEVMRGWGLVWREERAHKIPWL